MEKERRKREGQIKILFGVQFDTFHRSPIPHSPTKTKEKEKIPKPKRE